MNSPGLSRADSKVLEQVFDPGNDPASNAIVIDPSLPADSHVNDATLLQHLRSTERKAIGLIEAFETSRDRAPSSRDNVYRAALAILNQIVVDCPNHASARNNRAQLYRWRFGDRNMIVQTCTGTYESSQEREARQVLQDLKHSISLGSPDRPQDAVSPAQGKVLAQAYTQLGALYLAAAKDLKNAGGQPPEVVDEKYVGFSRENFEDEASRLFYLGGQYGGEVAKALAVHTNPHAKLCGAIVQEAMRKELSSVLI